MITENKLETLRELLKTIESNTTIIDSFLRKIKYRKIPLTATEWKTISSLFSAIEDDADYGCDISFEKMKERKEYLETSNK